MHQFINFLNFAPSWLILLAIASTAQAASTPPFPLVDDHRVAPIQFDSGDAEVVRIAANLFADDVERVTGRRPALMQDKGANDGQSVVIIGTVGKSPQIDRLIAFGKLDVTSLSGKWEGYLLTVVPDPQPGVSQALVIAGSDRRGTAYGVFTVSKLIGVSPWYWWADVPVKRQSRLNISLPASVSESPGVKYRGIFINDEDWGMNVWAKNTFEPEFKNIGPKTYEKVFELMLRLKLNYIWPAMHLCTTEFGATPANLELADKYAIVAGASHCEPMLCNNINWKSQKMGAWNYLTNRQAIHSYWEDNTKLRGSSEAVWTLGIRGIHDAGMQTPPVDMPGKLKLMTQVIDDQRDLIHQHVSQINGSIAQCFIPYKEVLPIYDAGLKVPDDVTLVWVDDNFGYLRRLSSPQERKRSGGAGVYYHLSYYGHPHSYTWINTTSPALIWEELHKAWENQAKTLWMLNVGDIKPAEIGIDYYAQLAWNPASMQSDSQPLFLNNFATENFGSSAAPQIAALLSHFYHLGTVRKPELMNREWAMTLSADRAAELELGYLSLLKDEQSLAGIIPADAQDAYKETIGFPARVLASTGLIFLADRGVQLNLDVDSNNAKIDQLRRELSQQVSNHNSKLAGGKWNRMMPGLVTGKTLTEWNSQVRWPWGEKSLSTNRELDKANSPLSPPVGQGWRSAADADDQSAGGAMIWKEVAGLGTSGHAMSLQPAEPDLKNSASTLEYNFNIKTATDAVAFIDFLPTFRLYPGLLQRVSVQIDDREEQMIEVPGSNGTENENGPIRSSAVQNNYVRIGVPMPGLSVGHHVLRIKAVDAGSAIDQVSLP